MTDSASGPPHDFLQPVLSEDSTVSSLYSQTALFIVSFFGGVFATAGMAFLNSKLLNRTNRDWPLLVFWIAVGISFTAWFLGLPQGHPYTEFFDSSNANRTYRYTMRILGIVAYISFYFLHGKNHRLNDMHGVENQKPWLPGIGVIIAASLFNYVLILFFQ